MLARAFPEGLAWTWMERCEQRRYVWRRQIEMLLNPEVYQYKARVKHQPWHEQTIIELERMQVEHFSKPAVNLDASRKHGRPSKDDASFDSLNSPLHIDSNSLTPAAITSIYTTRPYSRGA